MSYEQKMEARCQRMTELAEITCQQLTAHLADSRICEGPDVVSVLAVATAMAVIRLKSVDKGLAEETGAVAVRTIIKNLVANDVEMADLQPEPITVN